MNTTTSEQLLISPPKSDGLMHSVDGNSNSKKGYDSLRPSLHRQPSKLDEILSSDSCHSSSAGTIEKELELTRMRIQQELQKTRQQLQAEQTRDKDLVTSFSNHKKRNSKHNKSSSAHQQNQQQQHPTSERSLTQKSFASASDEKGSDFFRNKRRSCDKKRNKELDSFFDNGYQSSGSKGTADTAPSTPPRMKKPTIALFTRAADAAAVIVATDESDKELAKAEAPADTSTVATIQSFPTITSEKNDVVGISKVDDDNIEDLEQREELSSDVLISPKKKKSSTPGSPKKEKKDKKKAKEKKKTKKEKKKSKKDKVDRSNKKRKEKVAKKKSHNLSKHFTPSNRSLKSVGSFSSHTGKSFGSQRSLGSYVSEATMGDRSFVSFISAQELRKMPKGSRTIPLVSMPECDNSSNSPHSINSKRRGRKAFNDNANIDTLNGSFASFTNTSFRSIGNPVFNSSSFRTSKKQAANAASPMRANKLTLKQQNEAPRTPSTASESPLSRYTNRQYLDNSNHSKSSTISQRSSRMQLVPKSPSFMLDKDSSTNKSTDSGISFSERVKNLAKKNRESSSTSNKKKRASHKAADTLDYSYNSDRDCSTRSSSSKSYSMGFPMFGVASACISKDPRDSSIQSCKSSRSTSSKSKMSFCSAPKATHPNKSVSTAWASPFDAVIYADDDVANVNDEKHHQNKDEESTTYESLKGRYKDTKASGSDNVATSKCVDKAPTQPRQRALSDDDITESSEINDDPWMTTTSYANAQSSSLQQGMNNSKSALSYDYDQNQTAVSDLTMSYRLDNTNTTSRGGQRDKSPGSNREDSTVISAITLSGRLERKNNSPGRMRQKSPKQQQRDRPKALARVRVRQRSQTPQGRSGVPRQYSMESYGEEGSIALNASADTEEGSISLHDSSVRSRSLEREGNKKNIPFHYQTNKDPSPPHIHTLPRIRFGEGSQDPHSSRPKDNSPSQPRRCPTWHERSNDIPIDNLLDDDHNENRVLGIPVAPNLDEEATTLKSSSDINSHIESTPVVKSKIDDPQEWDIQEIIKKDANDKDTVDRVDFKFDKISDKVKEIASSSSHVTCDDADAAAGKSLKRKQAAIPMTPETKKETLQFKQKPPSPGVEALIRNFEAMDGDQIPIQGGMIRSHSIRGKKKPSNLKPISPEGRNKPTLALCRSPSMPQSPKSPASLAKPPQRSGSDSATARRGRKRSDSDPNSAMILQFPSVSPGNLKSPGGRTKLAVKTMSPSPFGSSTRSMEKEVMCGTTSDWNGPRRIVRDASDHGEPETPSKQPKRKNSKVLPPGIPKSPRKIVKSKDLNVSRRSSTGGLAKAEKKSKIPSSPSSTGKIPKKLPIPKTKSKKRITESPRKHSMSPERRKASRKSSSRERKKPSRKDEKRASKSQKRSSESHERDSKSPIRRSSSRGRRLSPGKKYATSPRTRSRTPDMVIRNSFRKSSSRSVSVDMATGAPLTSSPQLRTPVHRVQKLGTGFHGMPTLDLTDRSSRYDSSPGSSRHRRSTVPISPSRNDQRLKLDSTDRTLSSRENSSRQRRSIPFSPMKSPMKSSAARLKLDSTDRTSSQHENSYRQSRRNIPVSPSKASAARLKIDSSQRENSSRQQRRNIPISPSRNSCSPRQSPRQQLDSTLDSQQREGSYRHRRSNIPSSPKPMLSPTNLPPPKARGLGARLRESMSLKGGRNKWGGEKAKSMRKRDKERKK